MSEAVSYAEAFANAPIKFTPEDLEAAAERVRASSPLYEVGEAEIRGATYRVFKNAPPNLVGIFAFGATHGDKPFITFNDETLSFRDAFAQGCRFAHALKDQYGIGKGDRVAIAMRNYPEWCVAYMGVISLGAVVVPLNAWWKADELTYALKDCGAKHVVVDAKRLDYLKPVRADLGLTLILAREQGDGADARFEDLLAASETPTPPPVDIQPDDDFCISYTSGSTGHPKGVILTHRSAITALLSWAYKVLTLKEARGGVSPYGEDPGVLLGIPLFHVTGSHSIFMFSLIAGRRVVMMYRWTPQDACELIRKHELTSFVGVPSQSYELIDAAGEEGLPSLLDIAAGGAKRPADHVGQLRERFGGGYPSVGYGLTETNALGCVNSLQDYLDRPDSTGQAIAPVTDVKIFTEDGEETPIGEVGEVWIRSPATFRGYLNLPEETAKALTDDGWFRTGDLGRMDADGFVFIVDRLKDLIIRGGENISCLEVEARAYAHPSVGEAAAFSVPDEVLGERVGLVVFPKDGSDLDAKALRDFMADDLAGFKVPEHVWISPQALPRLGTEKFDKRTVKQVALHYPASWSAVAD
ncbi:MAG: class I adenylate-forming enzyme family protein [Pseudomonadota bacterium]